MTKKRYYLPKIFGETVQIKIIETLLKQYIEEEQKENLIWKNLSEIAEVSGVAKSSSKRILDLLLSNEFIEEKFIQTHASNPPRMFRLNLSNQVIKELLFFYKKVRGFL